MSVDIAGVMLTSGDYGQADITDVSESKKKNHTNERDTWRKRERNRGGERKKELRALDMGAQVQG